jgi:hypothetical protein
LVVKGVRVQGGRTLATKLVVSISNGMRFFPSAPYVEEGRLGVEIIVIA